MSRGPIVTTVALSVAASLALAPLSACAAGSRGGFVGGHAIAGRPGISHPFVGRPFVHGPFVHRPFVRGPFFAPPIVVYAPSLPYYSAPPVYYGPSAYYESSFYYAPPAAYAPSAGGTVAVAPAPAAAPTPSVVQYPTGRYELRGDGVTTPYTWVWIPNPPPPPPPAAPPEGAAPPPPASDPSPSHSQLYRWSDELGTVHWTDRWDAVPQQYRAQAKHRLSS
jgi:hypothetical protein